MSGTFSEFAQDVGGEPGFRPPGHPSLVHPVRSLRPDVYADLPSICLRSLHEFRRGAHDPSEREVQRAKPNGAKVPFTLQGGIIRAVH